jgi:hypothetical protein
MAKTKDTTKLTRITTYKRTSQGCGKVKLSSMNKHKKRSYKKYKGQGRP